MSQIIVKPNIIQPYKRLLDDWDKYYIAFLESGRGSGKSQGATKAGFAKLIEQDKFAIALIRSENTRLEQGIFKLFKMRANELNDKANNCFDARFELLDTKIKNKQTGIDVVFNYGLKASSVDLESKKGKAKGLEQINLAIIEEAQDIKDFEVVKTLIDTCIRENDFKIWLLFNPPRDRLHWLYAYYYDLVQSDEHDKYDRLEPKKDKERVLYLHSDYTQNPHLNEATKRLYADYKQSDNLDDYYHDILGLVPKDSGDQAIVKHQARTNDIYRNPDTGKDYTIESSFIKDRLAKASKLFIAIDDGADTVHPAAVLGYHVGDEIRDVVIKEFTGYTSSLSLALAIDDFINYHKLRQIADDYEVIADPALSWTANKNIYKDVLGKLNMLDWMRSNPNKLISDMWTNRLIKRTDNLSIITRAKCADGLPRLIIVKGTESKLTKYDFGCPDLYKGIFGGYFRWQLNKAGLVERGKLDQIKYVTDVCDALTYYLLNKYPPC